MQNDPTPMTFARLPIGSIEGAEVIVRTGIEDDRGCAFEVYRESWGLPRFQRHVSVFSWQGVLRGLHVMPRDRRMITPLFGSVHIVLADLRKNSPTQGRCVHRTSSWSQGESLLVPPGVAIGYLATSRHAIVSESSTSFDPPHAGAGVRWDAPGIRECFPPDIVPIVHARDQLLPTIESYLTREERDGDGQ